MTAQAQLHPETAPSLHTSIRSRIDELLPTCGLDDQRKTIHDAYALLCGRALRFPIGQRPLHRSRLNDDGTPFQLALAIAGTNTQLQFVSDVGPLSGGNARRGRAVRRDLPRIADTLKSVSWTSHLCEMLDEFAPPADPDLLRDESGPVWLGVSFAANRPPSLKAYVNARWGPEDARWSRLATLAGVAGVAHEWGQLRARAARLDPLGVSITVAGGALPKYRIYLGGYGRRLGYYEELARACGGAALAGLVGRYGRTLLADRYGHPTRSVVWSFGAEQGSFVDHKFELCGHCAFEDDVEARTRSLMWLRAIGASTAAYTNAVNVLSGTSVRPPRSRLHAYLGVGANGHRPYSTFYFNPAATLT